ncbi:MAG: rod-binding protein [Bacillota bacterium]|nr:rod-binding protein [Bacillota bacterium]
MDISGISNQMDFSEIANKINKNENKDFSKILSDSLKSGDDKKLKKVCEDFEAIFVNMLLKSMKTTIGENGFIEKSHAREVFESMLDEEMANNISSGKGIGIAKILYENLQDKGSNFDFKG